MKSERRPARRLKLELRHYLDAMFSHDEACWQAVIFSREMI